MIVDFLNTINLSHGIIIAPDICWLNVYCIT